MVPKSRPMSQVASPHAASSRSVSSGRAEVAKSRSVCGRPSIASRTGPPTSASSWPASANTLRRGRRPPARSAPARRPRCAGARPRSAAGGSGADTRVNSRAGRPIDGSRDAQPRGLTSTHAPPAVVQCCPGGAGGPGAAGRTGATPTRAVRRARTRQRRPSCARSRRRRRAEAGGEPTRQARPGRDRRPARGDHRPADPVDDPREGHGPGLRDDHQQRHRPLVDDQRLLVHLRRAADDPRPARRGSGHARGRRGRRPDHRRAAQGHHRGAGAGRPRDVQPQHPAQAAPRRHPRRLLVRRARAR